MVKFGIANGANRQVLPTSLDFTPDKLLMASADGQVEPLNEWSEANSPNRFLTPGANLTAEFTSDKATAFEVTRIL